MKTRILFLFFVILVGFTYSQTEYPLVSIHDVQFIDSVNSKGFVPSLYTGDTVRVKGVVMIRPLVNSDSNRTPVMYYGQRWGTYIQDTSSQADGWLGLNVIQNDTTGNNQNTFFDLVDSSDVVELTGWIYTYGQTNELILISNPAIPVNIIGKLPKRPDPIQLSVTDFMNNGVVDKSAIKYSGMYVELHNVISSDRNPSNGQFRINDLNGNNLTVYPQSRYFRTDANKMPGSTYQPPQDGTPINSIKGIITVYQSSFEILPIYPGDLTITLTPPTISSIKRAPVKVKTNETVTVSAKVVGGSGNITGVKLHSKVGYQAREVINMIKSLTDTSIYSAEISGVATDSTIVDYFITGNDILGLTGYNPSDTVRGNYFYQVLNEDLKIRDVQFSPFGSGFSAYNGYYVTLSGVLTADTSDRYKRAGNATNRIIMQDGEGPWCGIWLNALNTSENVYRVKLGDNVTVSGIIRENFNVTYIDSITSIVVNSSGNSLPEPMMLSTGDIDTKANNVVEAEQWESVLVGFENVTVTDLNADGNPGSVNNFGEISVNDGTGNMRVELQDGNHFYHNVWDSTLLGNSNFIEIKENGHLEKLTGIMYFSFSNYKLVPRYNSDFVGYTVVAVNDKKNELLDNYSLSQNYPNPFNPATTISYSIPKAGNVSLKIFNVLGQEVHSLINEYQNAGTYKVSFDASSLTSGVYFYTLSTDNFLQVKKMMLVK